MPVRAALGVAFLTLQAALVVSAQFQESKSFCWAPHTVQVAYELDVRVAGRMLSQDEIRRRYGLWNYGWEVHAPANLTALIEQHARTYGRHEQVETTLRYRVNGGPVVTWAWPPR